MNPNNIFISYNPFSNDEKVLAEGLYKKGRQNGFQLFIPERGFNNKLNNLTKSKIIECEWFVVFCFGELSDIVREEIEFAFSQNIKQENIIVVFSRHHGQTINFNNLNPTIKYIDRYTLENVENFSDDLLRELIDKHRLSKNKPEKRKEVEEDFSVLKVILGIGAAALIISALTSNEKK